MAIELTEIEQQKIDSLLKEVEIKREALQGAIDQALFAYELAYNELEAFASAVEANRQEDLSQLEFTYDDITIKTKKVRKVDPT